MFCQQDRAILCRECDVSIHKANEHTQKHNRFLLTGVKVSANSSLYSESPSVASCTTNQDSVTNLNKSQICTKKPLPVSSSIPQEANIGENSYTSSISEYLQMLPGWHVEEFMDSSAIPTNGFCKIGDNDEFPIWNIETESTLNSFSPESIGIWVPQAPPAPPPPPQKNQNQIFPQSINFGGQIESKNIKEVTTNKSSRKWRDDNSFAVPQISPSSISFKRSRTLW